MTMRIAEFEPYQVNVTCKAYEEQQVVAHALMSGLLQPCTVERQEYEQAKGQNDTRKC